MPRTTQMLNALNRLETLRAQLGQLPSLTAEIPPTTAWNALQDAPTVFVSTAPRRVPAKPSAYLPA